MTSSKKLPQIETWSYRSAFADSWLSEAFARDTETLTKALQKSFSNNNDINNNNSVPETETLASDLIAPFIAPETPTASNVSGSESETIPKRHRTSVPGPNTGRITKRKQRASKKTQTTVIAADPANFRQLVQQVTGVRFGNAQVQMVPVLKPEPQRLGGGRLPGISSGCLPTLDTSAFLLDHHQQMGSASGSGVGTVFGSGHFDFQAALVGDGSSAALDFDAFSSFPTLESWKVL